MTKRIDRRCKPPITVTAIGTPLAIDSLAALILRRLSAEQRPNLVLVVNDEQSRSPLSEVVEGP